MRGNDMHNFTVTADWRARADFQGSKEDDTEGQAEGKASRR